MSLKLFKKYLNYKRLYMYNQPIHPHAYNQPERERERVSE
jgi:hypothetical protein